MDKPSLELESSATSVPCLNSWDHVAKLDALGVVLSERRKPYDSWTLDEFYATGETEVSAILEKCRELGITLDCGQALDFGCGVGRLSRSLASRFSHCVGVDVSAQMVSRARELNKHLSNCEFVVNHSARIPFPSQSFDFVLSIIVLQHMKTREIEDWVREFGRILRPGGIAVFQLPDKPSLRRRIQGRRRIWSLLRFLGVRERFLYETLRLTPIKMNGVSPDRVRSVMETAGAEMIRIEEDDKAGEGFCSHLYFAKKKDLL